MAPQTYGDDRGDDKYGKGIPQEGYSEHCVEVDWPAQRLWSSYAQRTTWEGHLSWMGSLIQHGRDESGQLYRRNRYYDPSSGRFTQEDPSGIAGGLNVYGYAGGDPVHYSDPFGLCKEKNEEAESECPPEVVKTTVSSNGGSVGSTTTVINEYAPLSQEQVDHVINEKRMRERIADGFSGALFALVAGRLGLRTTPSAAGGGLVVSVLGSDTRWQYMPHVGDKITTTVTTTPWATRNQQSFVVQRADGSVLRLSGSPWKP